MIEIEGKCDLCLIVEYENHSNKSKTSLAYQIRYFLVVFESKSDIFESRIGHFELEIRPLANPNQHFCGSNRISVAIRCLRTVYVIVFQKCYEPLTFVGDPLDLTFDLTIFIQCKLIKCHLYVFRQVINFKQNQIYYFDLIDYHSAIVQRV